MGEAWLLESDPSSFVTIDGCTIIRADVSGHNRKHGAAVYIANTVKYEDVEVDLPKTITL